MIFVFPLWICENFCWMQMNAKHSSKEQHEKGSKAENKQVKKKKNLRSPFCHPFFLRWFNSRRVQCQLLFHDPFPATTPGLLLVDLREKRVEKKYANFLNWRQKLNILFLPYPTFFFSFSSTLCLLNHRLIPLFGFIYSDWEKWKEKCDETRVWVYQE